MDLVKTTPSQSQSNEVITSTVLGKMTNAKKFVMIIAFLDKNMRYFALSALLIMSAHAQTALPMPQVSISDVVPLPTVWIDGASGKFDSTDIDLFLAQNRKSARHYPPSFANKTAQYNATKTLKNLIHEISPVAQNPNASYDVLYRAAALHAMAKNLDLGAEHGVRASEYLGRALKLRSNDSDANVLYGIMLAESGAFKEGAKYLNKADGLEAQQALAQIDLLEDRKESARSRLVRLAQNATGDDATLLNQQIAIIDAGGYYIWQLP